MASLTLVIGRDPAQLLERAADGFLAPLAATPENPFPSPTYLLALRQGGVRDDLIALAGARGVPGWFDPPLCVFPELPKWLGATARQPCGDFERAALLAHVIRRSKGSLFGTVRLEDFLGSVEQFFGELVAEEVSPDDYRAVQSRVQAVDAFERARDAALAQLYGAYCEELDQHGLRDGRDTLADCARAVWAGEERVRELLGGRREIRVFGLHDLLGGWRPLLAALTASPALDRVVVYSGEALPIDPGLSPEVSCIDEHSTVATRLFTSNGVGDEHFDVIEAPTVERELGEVARRVRRLVDGGIEPDCIAVVARQARPYVDLALRALGKFNVPATARRRYAYQEIPAVRAILTFFGAAADGWQRQGLVELADQPYLATQLDSRVLNLVGYRRVTRGLATWRDSLQALERETVDAAGNELEDIAIPSRRVTEARAAFEEFVPYAAELEKERPLLEWIQWLEQFVAADPWGIEPSIYEVPESRFDIAKRDLAGWRGLIRILSEWREALARWPATDGRVPVAQFNVRLREMLWGDVALWTETRRGVRVLESLAAAYRSFEHVFLVGMQAGRFPLPAPRSPLLDAGVREAYAEVGIPLDRQADFDARECSLFRTLVGGARVGLTVSFPRLDTLGQESIRSSFVDALADAAMEVKAAVHPIDVVTPDMPMYRSQAVAAHAARMAAMERDRRAGARSAYGGYLTAPETIAWLSEEFGDEKLWSATQLEAYAKCPWAYFSKYLLRLEKREDLDDELEATTRGRIFHAALARFYDRAREQTGGDVYLRNADLEWAEPLLIEAMGDTVKAFAETTWLGHPVLWSARRQELERVLVRYLRWEAQLHEDTGNNRKKVAGMLRTAVHAHEHRFDEAVLNRNDVRVRFRGTIDRVEVGSDERARGADEFVAAVDYKTSVAGAPGGGDEGAWADNVVLQVPLYAHALTQIGTGSRPCRVEYRALISPRRLHSLELQRVNQAKGIHHGNTADLQKMERALDAVTLHVLRVRCGEFPAQPAPSCLCPPFCHAWDICRIPGGPVVKRDPR